VDPHDQQPASAAEDQPASNLFAPILGLVAIGLLACTVWALGLSDSQVAEGLSRCGAITNERARLACYDKLAEPHPPARGAFGLLPNPHEGSQ
jgi:hypothetical protein